MRQLERKHLAVLKAASTDETRYILQGAYVEEKEYGLQVTATDGRMLATLTPNNNYKMRECVVSVPDTVSNSGTAAIVPTELLKQAGKLLPSKMSRGLVQVATVIGKDSTTFINNEGATVSGKNIEGTFPNYEQVIPTGKPSLSITFSPDLLGRALAIAKEIGIDSLKLEFTGPLTPVKMTGTIDGYTLTLVVMPMRGE